MAKEEIKKLIENSKEIIDQDKDDFTKSIKNDLSSFKRRNKKKYSKIVIEKFNFIKSIKFLS